MLIELSHNYYHKQNRDQELITTIYNDSELITDLINSKNYERDFRNIINIKKPDLINILNKETKKEMNEIGVINKFKLLKVSKNCFIYEARFAEFLSESRYETYNLIRVTDAMGRRTYNGASHSCSDYKNCYLFLTEKGILDDTEVLIQVRF